MKKRRERERDKKDRKNDLSQDSHMKTNYMQNKIITRRNCLHRENCKPSPQLRKLMHHYENQIEIEKKHANVIGKEI